MALTLSRSIQWDIDLVRVHSSLVLFGGPSGSWDGWGDVVQGSTCFWQSALRRSWST